MLLQQIETGEILPKKTELSIYLVFSRLVIFSMELVLVL